MSFKNSGLLLVRIGFIATVALLYNFVVNADCMLCLVCIASCFCVDPWCGISFSVCEIILFMTFVCADLSAQICEQKIGLDVGLRKQFLHENLKPWKFKSPSLPRRE